LISVRFDNVQFEKDMKNILDYSSGFMEGTLRGKKELSKRLGEITVEGLKQFIDSNARVNPEALQHVYEWYMSGSPDARLFDITYTITGSGLSLQSTFRQSSSIKSGSDVPFYDKARIMEYGIPVTITPRKSQKLVFEQNGETVFTSGTVKVSEPGGKAARGGLEESFNIFMSQYFSQAFLRSTGIVDYLENPFAYVKNLKRGKKVGRSAGLETGYKWITSIGAGIE
tara:strand:+ start:30 stop:710 length:681 start_codon:yes stop_codon:yes gene_type:complete